MDYRGLCWKFPINWEEKFNEVDLIQIHADI